MFRIIMAGEIFDGFRVVGFDLETTGFDVRKERIVEYALIGSDVDGSDINLQSLVYPEKRIPFEASNVHGIKDQDVRDSGNFSVLDSCDIEKTGDVILAAIHYLRFVEKETNTPPRELKNLVSQSGKWGKEDVEKWNLSLYINRMLEGGVTGKKQEPFLEYPTGMPKKNRYVVLTDAGRNYLESLTRV